MKWEMPTLTENFCQYGRRLGESESDWFKSESAFYKASFHGAKDLLSALGAIVYREVK